MIDATVLQSPPSAAAAAAKDQTSEQQDNRPPAQPGPRDRGHRPSNVKLVAGTPVTVRSTEWEGDRGGAIVKMESPGIARVRVDLVPSVDKALIGSNGGSPTLQVEACTVVAGFGQVAGGFAARDGRKLYAAVQAGAGELLETEVETIDLVDREELNVAFKAFDARITEVEKRVPEIFAQIKDLHQGTVEQLNLASAVCDSRVNDVGVVFDRLNKLSAHVDELMKRIDALEAKPAAAATSSKPAADKRSNG